MMLDDCKDLAGVLAAIADALKPNGRLLLSLNNPYAIVTRGKVDDYFASGPLTQTFGTERAEFEVPFHYRTFEEWVSGVSAGGPLAAQPGRCPAGPVRPASAGRAGSQDHAPRTGETRRVNAVMRSLPTPFRYSGMSMQLFSLA